MRDLSDFFLSIIMPFIGHVMTSGCCLSACVYPSGRYIDTSQKFICVLPGKAESLWLSAAVPDICL